MSRFLITATLALSLISSASSQPDDLEGYEYVVVGSGAGGGPLAANLARQGRKVLLLEAGDDQGANPVQQIPAFNLASTEDPRMRWDYFVQHHADEALTQRDSKMTWDTPSGTLHVGPNPPSGSTPKGILYPRAGTLGGCSAHNALITVYPHESDWTHIAQLTGDSSWSPSNMRTYFKRLERCEYLPANTPGHGFSGWLGTTPANLSLALGDTKIRHFIRAAAAAMADKLIELIPEAISQLVGLVLRDMNSASPLRDRNENLYQIPLSMSSGRRSGTREFLVQTAQNYSLDIRTNALVTRVLFDPATVGSSSITPKAIGVEFLEGPSLYKADPRSSPSSSGTLRRAIVSREVILAAGAFNTPQLLKLSGVGPQDELQQFGIPVIKHLPGVGSNLQDRYEIPVVSKTRDNFTIRAECTPGLPNDPCVAQWAQQQGPYLSNGVVVGIIKRSSQAAAAGLDPDLFIFGSSALFRGYFPGYSSVARADQKHFSWLVLKAHTLNQDGVVRLRSADPRDVPYINFNYFTSTPSEAAATERDLSAISEGVQFARRIMDLVPRSLTGPFEEETPGRNSTSSVAQIKDYIKKEAWGHHASCSCPIGADGDPKAVLDSRFRVRGVRNLRVVDASVFPRIPGFFIAVPIYMISEKATDVILQDETP